MSAVFLVLAVFAATPPNPFVSAAFDRQQALQQVELVGRVTETVPVLGKPGDTWVYEGPLRIVFDGSRTRVEDTRTHTTRGGTTRSLNVCDGSTFKEFIGPPGKETWQNAIGHVTAAERRCSVLKAEWLPAFAFARPLGATGYELPWLDFNRMIWTGEQAWTGEEATDRLELRPDRPHPLPPPLPEAYGEVLMGKDALPRSLRLTPPREGVTETKIAYTRHDSGVLVPASWEVRLTGSKGEPGRAVKVVIDRVTLNRQWTDGEFDITFPPGVRVSDQRTGKEYLVREDGSISTVKYGDDGSPMSTPNSPPAPTNWFSTYGPMAFFAVLVAGLVVVFILKRTRRKA